MCCCFGPAACATQLGSHNDVCIESGLGMGELPYAALCISVELVCWLLYSCFALDAAVLCPRVERD